MRKPSTTVRKTTYSISTSTRVKGQEDNIVTLYHVEDERPDFAIRKPRKTPTTTTMRRTTYLIFTSMRV